MNGTERHEIAVVESFERFGVVIDFGDDGFTRGKPHPMLPGRMLSGIYRAANGSWQPRYATKSTR